MDSIVDVKEALAARSETTSLDELRSRGRRRVKVVRAEQIAAMIAEAVQRAVEQSGLVKPEELQELTEKSRREFERVVHERRQEAEATRQAQEDLEQTRDQLQEARHALRRARTAQDAAEQATAELEEQLATARRDLEQANKELESVRVGPGQTAAMDPALMMRMMQQLALAGWEGAPAADAGLAASGAAGPTAGSGGATPDMMATLNKLAETMNQRLEQFGKKMGISSAVEAGEVHFEGLFRDMDSQQIESNLENLEVKKKTGSGIAGNLARLKKLKGG